MRIPCRPAPLGIRLSDREREPFNPTGPGPQDITRRSHGRPAADGQWRTRRIQQAAKTKRKQDAIDYMAQLIPAHGVDEAASLAAERYGLKASTLRGYYFEARR